MEIVYNLHNSDFVETLLGCPKCNGSIKLIDRTHTTLSFRDNRMADWYMCVARDCRNVILVEGFTPSTKPKLSIKSLDMTGEEFYRDFVANNSTSLHKHPEEEIERYLEFINSILE